MGGDLMAQQWDVPGYTEVKALGSGGFGDVVLARHEVSGTLVAIKYLRRELLADPEFAVMFRGEAEVLASVEDPNVVRLYEYVQSPAGAAIVMELVDGVSLREILARQGKTTAEAALVVLQGSLLGLAAAHRRGVVHRDYKPENVLVNGQGASKLTDFGIAARAGDRAMAAGTLAYAPPEQFGGGPASPSGDVYAATATFYECLTGRPPFSGDSAERLLYQHLAEPVPLEPVPGPLRPLIEAGMAKDPGRRPADATILVSELRTVAAGAYGPDWEERGRSGLAAAALLLAALWPSGGPAAVQGAAVHRIRLRRHLRPRHIAPAKTAIAAGVAVAVVAVAVVATHTTSKPPTAAKEPTAATFTTSGDLTAVATTSADSAWAVGTAGSGNSSRTLILHWNGTTWTRTPSPDLGTCQTRVGVTTASSIADVAAASADSAWAVGSVGCDTSTRTLILHWNGTTWTRVPSPSPGQGAVLLGVTTTSAGTAWAIGNISSDTGTSPLILRWNGTAWTTVPSPSPAGSDIYGVATTPGGGAWAVGCISCGTSSNGTLILRWNGTAWTTVPSPSPAGSILSTVAAASADSAWAIGVTISDNSNRPLTMHWNGTAWTTVPTGLGPDASLRGMAAPPAGTAWTVGNTGVGSGAGTLILRWNGTGWTRVPSPVSGAGLVGITALSGSDAWAVGAADGKTLVLRWNGQTWSGPAGQASPGGAQTSSPGPSVVSSSAPAAVSSPAVASRRQAAQALAGLLAQSGTDRTVITQAFNAVADCSAGLSQDETIFTNAASSHEALLGKLAGLAGRSALPGSMLQDLTAAWQASGQADQDFANWTRDEIAHGCSTNYQSDASYRAATRPDDQATTDKKAFAALWASIASEYDLPAYQYNQI
jgi:eukaryotic-like serine/threonine-protein kinase